VHSYNNINTRPRCFTGIKYNKAHNKITTIEHYNRQCMIYNEIKFKNLPGKMTDLTGRKCQKKEMCF